MHSLCDPGTVSSLWRYPLDKDSVHIAHPVLSRFRKPNCPFLSPKTPIALTHTPRGLFGGDIAASLVFTVVWCRAVEVGNSRGTRTLGGKGESRGGRKRLEEAAKVETRLLGVNRNSYWLAWGNPTRRAGPSPSPPPPPTLSHAPLEGR